ncbi:MAG: thymidine phosphorylase, partial [Clostridia bacterium]|nr:thymidine phosphorylase [Clostridia bacterium]
MRMYDIILKKRNGEELTDGEIAFFIDGYTRGEIPDYQASALMMAIFYKGMTDRETVCLTDRMAHSGDTVDLSRFGEMSVDKHSTGGVGDKTSLIVAPIVASLGGKVTKMSGRGLGHTGGTVDKLESISGYNTSLTPDAFLSQVERVGMAIIGQTGNLTPADKKLYALRDVTATVDSIPLITSSIMSKKIAAGSHNIVLDVKVGSGAFMKTPRDAEILAEKMVEIGKACGRNIAAVITDMDSPLGNNVGNALEVAETVSVLKNEKKGDLREVSVALATEMVSLVFGLKHDEAEKKVVTAIEDGSAFEKMKEWIAAQGGDVAQIEDTSLLPRAKFSFDVLSDTDGYITEMNAEEIGKASVMLGVGRASKEDKIDYAAG